MQVGRIADKDGGGQTINNNALFNSKRNNSKVAAKYGNNPSSPDVSDGVTSVKMAGESEGMRRLMMVLVVVLMMMAVATKAAFIDRRPKMPRYPALFLLSTPTGAPYDNNNI